MSLFHAQCKSLEEIEEMTDNRCQIEEWREKNGLYQQRLSLKSKNSREKTANDCRTTTSSISGWNTEIYCLKDVTMLTIFRFQKQIFQSQETKPILAHVRETQIFYLLHEHWAHCCRWQWKKFTPTHWRFRDSQEVTSLVIMIPLITLSYVAKLSFLKKSNNTDRILPNP